VLADLDARLAEAAQRVSRWERLERRLAALTEEAQAAAESVQGLRDQLQREEHEVARLEGISLGGLFYGLLGTKEDRLRQERQEAVAARLRHDEAVHRLAAVQAEQERVRREQDPLADSREQYQALLVEKEKQIAATPGDGARQLFNLGDAERRLEWELQQLREAILAGQAADAALAPVEESLNSAHSWGVWDMLGGGLIATSIKHSRVDEAQQAAYAAQQALSAFRRELKDVDLDFTADGISIEGFSRFADYFFDGLIADWVVQNRINESLDSVRRAREQVAALLDRLQQQVPETEADLAAARQRRAEFVTRYPGH